MQTDIDADRRVHRSTKDDEAVTLANDADAVNRDRFRQLFGAHAASVCLVTFAVAGEPRGFTATSVTSVSLQPSILAFSVMHSSSCWEALRHTERVAIHFLSPGDEDLATRFAGPGTERFRDLDWRIEQGAPVFDRSQTFVFGDVVQRLEVGAGTLVTVKARGVNVAADRAPLVYSNRNYRALN